MAINLLPTEEKSKTKQHKADTTSHIEMTGLAKSKGAKPGVKRAGVLTFFKGAFAKPKKPVDEATGALLQVPKKKVQVEQKIILEKQHVPQEKKKVLTYQKPVRPKPSGKTLAAKKDGNILIRLFRREKAPPVPPTPPPHIPGEQFPKYTPIKAERVSHQPKHKKRNGDVIKITTQSAAPIPVAKKKKPKKDSIFSRMAAWFSDLFRSSGKQEKKKAHDEIPEVKPVVAKEKPSVVFEKQEHDSFIGNSKKEKIEEKFIPIPLHQTRENIKSIAVAPEVKPLLVPPPPPKKEAPAPPLPKIVPEVQKKHSPQNIKKESIKEKGVKKDVPPPPKKDSDKKENWFSAVIARITGMFSKKGKEEKKKTAAEGGDNEVPEAGLEWEVNLVPEEALEQEISISRVMLLGMFVALAAGIVFAGWLWANWFFNSITTKIEEVNRNIAIVDIQINSYQNVQDDVKQLKKDIDNVQVLLEKHVYWSSIFQQLERYAGSDVYFTSLSADVNGSVGLKAVGRNYESAVKQLFVFERATDFVNDVVISDIAFVDSPTEDVQTGVVPQVSNSSVTFSIQLKVLPSIFYFPR